MRTARSIGLVVGLTIAVLVATGAMLTFVHYNSAAKQQRLVSNNYDTISLMRQALIVLQDAEIGQRAYLLTGDIANLEPYERARLRFDPIVRQLEAASADDSGALRQIAEFRSATTEKLGELNATIVAYQLYGRDATLPRNAGRSTTDHIRQVADAFIEGQTLLLSSRLAALRSEREQADVAGLLVLGGAFVCLIVGMFLIVRGGVQLETAQAELSARTRLLQTTLETLNDPIFVLDAEGRVVAWNEAFASLAVAGSRRARRRRRGTSCCRSAFRRRGRCCSRCASASRRSRRRPRRASPTRAGNTKSRAAKCRAAAPSCAAST